MCVCVCVCVCVSVCVCVCVPCAMGFHYISGKVGKLSTDFPKEPIWSRSWSQDPQVLIQ